MTQRSWVVGLALAALGVGACGGGGSSATLARQPGVPDEPAAATASSEPPTTVVTPPPPTTAAPTTTVAPPPPPPPPPATAPLPGLPWTVAVYRGLGTWVDVYDWSQTYTREAGPAVGPQDVDRMAASGVQTLYIQASKWDSPTDVLEPERLLPIIGRAHDLGIRVVAWYLPTFEDPVTDVRRLLAVAALPVDGLAVDIESSKVADPAERTRRLLAVSGELRRALPGRALGAIPYPPVLLDVVNPRLWPGFPWRELAPFYDVWLPMSYQTYRSQDSGYRDAYRYAGENIDRLRVHMEWLDAPVHVIGGIADRTGPGDVEGIHRAVTERAGLGASLYDWRTTHPDLWPALQTYRSAEP
jgi:hypothetical protein